MPQIIRQRGTGPRRHQVGIPGDIISECPGDFIGIRKNMPFRLRDEPEHGRDRPCRNQRLLPGKLRNYLAPRFEFLLSRL
jgi:hypothetical protein